MELRSRRRHSRRPVSIYILLLLVAVVAIWAYLNGLFLPGVRGQPTLTPTLSGEIPPATRIARPSPTLTITPSASTVTTPSSTTPADEWAREILTEFIAQHDPQAVAPADGLAWWHRQNVRGELGWVDEQPVLDDRVQDMTQVQTLTIFMPDPDSLGQLVNLGAGVVDGGALALGVTHTGSYWLLGGVQPEIAIKALIMQAVSQEVVLTAAFSPGFGADLQLILLDFQRLSAPTVTPTPSLHPSITVTATRTPTLTPTVTPTRQPDPFMLDLIAPKIDPAIDAAGSFNPSGVFAVMTDHPFTGILTWTESGPHIASRPIAVSEAAELSIFSLEPDDPSGRIVLLWTVEYQNGTTRFPDDLIIFQGQRMDEVLFWMVRHAAARGGQLFVAYDDFGLQQNLIILGFRAFSTPTLTPTVVTAP